MKPRFSLYTKLKWKLLKSNSTNLPLASEVLTAALESSPHWTSYFVPYRAVLNDQYAYSHFNWSNREGVNYHVLRIGCYPYIKYHCSRRPYENLKLEDRLYTVLKALNLGIPTLAYGIAGHWLIRYHKDVKLVDSSGQLVRIYFLYKEDVGAQH